MWTCNTNTGPAGTAWVSFDSVSEAQECSNGLAAKQSTEVDCLRSVYHFLPSDYLSTHSILEPLALRRQPFPRIVGGCTVHIVLLPPSSPISMQPKKWTSWLSLFAGFADLKSKANTTELSTTSDIIGYKCEKQRKPREKKTSAQSKGSSDVHPP